MEKKMMTAKIDVEKNWNSELISLNVNIKQDGVNTE